MICRDFIFSPGCTCLVGHLGTNVPPKYLRLVSCYHLSKWYLGLYALMGVQALKYAISISSSQNMVKIAWYLRALLYWAYLHGGRAGERVKKSYQVSTSFLLQAEPRVMICVMNIGSNNTFSKSYDCFKKLRRSEKRHFSHTYQGHISKTARLT